MAWSEPCLSALRIHLLGVDCVRKMASGSILHVVCVCINRIGTERTWVVEVTGFDRPDYLAGKEVTHERMEELGPVILMDGKRFEAGLTGEGRKVTKRIRADMEGQ